MSTYNIPTTFMMTTNAKVWTLSTCALFAKMMITTSIQRAKTFAAGARPPEDASLSAAKYFDGVNQTYGVDTAPVDPKLQAAKIVEVRWRRILLNDLENIPIGLLVFGAGVLTNANPTIHLVAMTMFTAARFAHTIVYAYSLQPHRTIFSLIARLAGVIGVGNAIASVAKAGL